MPELDALYEVFAQIGEDPAQILTPETAYLVAYGQDVVGMQSVPGVIIIPERTKHGIHARVTVLENYQLENPVHLCFSLFERFGVQNIDLELTLQAHSKATFWSHCLFTVPEVARHAMTAQVTIQEGAELVYNEVHYHGLSGGIEVIPRATVKLEPHARYRADFSLVQGRVGKLDIDYEVTVAEEGVAELTSKVYGHVADEIRIRETVSLDGDNARGLIKSRVALDDEATAEITGATYGNAMGTRGHVDCLEIVRGSAKASAIPEVRVSHPQAKVTHEAAIGSVDQAQLETLMARGLSPEDAVDRIILGILR
ncbi:SufB/SufD family protein [Thiohalophilus sp.]|uniref:SufB/SufD family protein n=1 Tax=Thiohalophilus sp. TaxID=3028392 RepID=UPI002ACE4742|nr:SufD family Fe-S cluster assembly protein [Thiohalophilus sp.]MDZ7802692.1 SufD family Fe-S cluster assembly protein [Thiohalophilus sp.]